MTFSHCSAIANVTIPKVWFDSAIALCAEKQKGQGRVKTSCDIMGDFFSGFGIGDTHQLVNSISHEPDGSLWFTQGLHAMSRVESP